MYRKASIFILIAVIAGLILQSNTVYSSDKETTDELNIALSPSLLNLVTNPGQPVASQFKVTNNSNHSETIKFSLVKFVQNKDDISPIVVNKSDKFAKWFMISATSLTIAPHESKKIKLKISPPSSAALTYYYGVKITRQNEQTNENKSNILPILLDVRSVAEKKSLTVTQFTATQMIYSELPVKFNLILKNAGNVHIIPFGQIFVDKNFTRISNTVPVNQKGAAVLPGNETDFHVEWNNNYHLNLSNLAALPIGQYKAHLIMVYNNGTREVPLTAVVAFWILPWKLLLVDIILLVVLLFGVKWIVASVHKRR